MAKKTFWQPMKTPPNSHWFFTHARYYSAHRKIEREFNTRKERDAWIKRQNELVASCKNDQEYLITMDILLTLTS